ncbi:MAG: cytochrome C [Campylobacteraceae bacterium 4484_166]|nr:MAG: cytochrome C [Campylobacteraceae bacterium 4484_166]
MNKLLKIALSAVVLTALSSTVASANIHKGQKLYAKKLKGSCGFTGAKMAAKHSQDEWKTINTSGKMAAEIKKLCPKSNDLKEKYLIHLFDFFHEFANDSGNVPSC